MAIVGKLQDGTLKLKGEINERLPMITNGLIMHYPFDSTLNHIKDISCINILEYHINTSHPWLDYFTSAGASITNTADITTIDTATALQYDLILVDCYAWAVDSTIIDKLKAFTDAGVSCVAMGNDTRTNCFVSSYNAVAHVTHDINIASNFPIETSTNVYTNAGSSDVFGGITNLKNGAVPYYYRADTGEITGYIYESSKSNAVFYFDQEGLAVPEFVLSAFKYVIGKSKGNMTNTGTTLTNDGLSSEETTTNLISNGDTKTLSHWYASNGSDTNGTSDGAIALVTDEFLNRKVIEYTLTKRYGWGAYWQNAFNEYASKPYFDTSKQYTLSFKARRMNEVGGLTVSIRDGSHANAVMNDVNVSLTNLWQTFTYTFTPLIIGNIPVIYFINSTLGCRMRITDVQLEQKFIPTTFTPSTRSIEGNMSILFNTGSDFTLFYKYIPNGDWAPSFSITSYANKELWFLYDKNTSKKVWLYDYIDGGSSNTTTSPWIGFDEFVTNTYTPWHWYSSAKHVAGKEYWFALTKLGAVWTKYMFTELGYYTISTTQTDASLIAFTPNKFEIRNSYDWKIKDLSIYNRALSEVEIKKLTSNKFDLNLNGNVNNKINERINKIPSNSYYYPLGYDTLDKNKIYNSITNANLLYEKGSVWVGLATTNQVTNPDGSIGQTLPGSYQPGWDNSLHPTALAVNNWSGGYNSGLPSPTIGYHAQWVREGMSGPYDVCMKFIDRNDIYSLGHRWLGISQNLGTPTSLGWTVGTVITISWYQKSDVLNKGIRCGVYHKRIDNSTYDFESCIQTINVTKINTWERVSFTYTITSNWDLTTDCNIYLYGNYGVYGTLWADKIQVQQSSYLSPYVGSSNGAGLLEYNLNSSIGLDWSGDWSIVYWKKPIGTHTGDMTGYNLESLGCSNNNVGTGYIYWGKNNGLNTIYSSTPSTFAVSDYFGNYHMISLVKNGTTLTIKEWLNGGPYVRTVTLSGIVSNYYVNQFGYDFMLGGWDNGNPVNSYYKDLIVAKRAFTNAEIDAMRQTQFIINGTNLQIQNNLSENCNL